MANPTEMSDMVKLLFTSTHPQPSTSTPATSSLWINSRQPTNPEKLTDAQNEMNKKAILLIRNNNDQDVIDGNFSLVDLATTGDELNEPDEQGHKNILAFRKRNDEECLNGPSNKDLAQYNKDVENTHNLYYNDEKFAFFRVTKKEEKGYVLTSLYVNLFGRDLMKYKQIWLDDRSMEVYEKCHFDGKLLIGDLIKVFKLRRDEGDRLRVHKFALYPREIHRNVDMVLTRHGCNTFIVVPGFPGTCIEHTGTESSKLPRFFDDDFVLYKCDVFIPAHASFKSSKDFVPSANLVSLKYDIAMELETTWEFQNVVFNCRKNENGMKKLRHWDNCAHYGITKEAMDLMSLKLRIGCAVFQNIHRARRAVNQKNDFVCARESVEEFSFRISNDYHYTLGEVGRKVLLVNRVGSEMIIEITKVTEVNRTELAVRAKWVDGEKNSFNLHMPVLARLTGYEGVDFISILKASEKRILNPTCVSIMAQLHGNRDQLRKQRDPKFVIDTSKLNVKMNKQQSLFIENVIDDYSIMLLHGPSKSGKTFSIIVSLIVWCEYQLALHSNCEENIRPILVIAKTEKEVKELADVAERFEKYLPLKKLRFILRDGNNQIPLNLQTAYDLPVRNDADVRDYMKTNKPKLVFATVDSTLSQLSNIMGNVQKIMVDNAGSILIVELEVLSRAFPTASVLLTASPYLTSWYGCADFVRNTVIQCAYSVASKNNSIKQITFQDVYKNQESSSASTSSGLAEQGRETTLTREANPTRRDWNNEMPYSDRREREPRVRSSNQAEFYPQSSHNLPPSRYNNQSMEHQDREYRNEHDSRMERDEPRRSGRSDDYVGHQNTRSSQNNAQRQLYNDENSSSFRYDRRLETNRRPEDDYRRNERDRYQESRGGHSDRSEGRRDHRRNDVYDEERPCHFSNGPYVIRSTREHSDDQQRDGGRNDWPNGENPRYYNRNSGDQRRDENRTNDVQPGDRRTVEPVRRRHESTSSE